MIKVVITPLTLADETILQSVFAFDHIAAAGDSERQAELRTAASEGQLYVAQYASTAVGYHVLAPWWFGADFLQLLYVDASRRRSGIASALVRDAVQRVDGRLFTSTNQSNLPMQSLLESLGWQRCGRLEGLDDGDPEVFYRTE